MEPGSSGTLATARTPSTAAKPVTAGPPATACSKGTAETPRTPFVTPGTSAIAKRPATGKNQELKGRQQQQECLPLSGSKQPQWHKQQQQGQHQATLRMTAISWPLTTAGMQATAGMKATAGTSAYTVWTPPKAGMLPKNWSWQQHGGRPTAAETMGTSQLQQQKRDPYNKDARNNRY